ncbi:uncharacterized protein lbhl [Spinachia spinachia]
MRTKVGSRGHRNACRLWYSRQTQHGAERVRQDALPSLPPSPTPPHTGFALEAKSLLEASAEGESCGSCSPPPAPPRGPRGSPVLIVEEAGFTTVRLCRDGDFCLTAREGCPEEMSGDPNWQDGQRKGRRFSFQIFPDPVEVALDPETTMNRLDLDHVKERLPSIVVEPTELSEVESGELRWPPESVDMEEDEEDLFLEQCIPPANIADWGEEEEEEEEEEEQEEEEETSVILNEHHGMTLIDLESDAFRDDTPTLPPSSAPALN